MPMIYGDLKSSDLGYPKRCVLDNPRNTTNDWSVYGTLVAVLHTVDASDAKVSQLSIKIADGQTVNFTMPSGAPINDGPAEFQ